MSEWVRELLGEALDAVEARDFELALDRLLSSWVADLDPAAQQAIELAWRERISSGDAGDVGVLLERLIDVGPPRSRCSNATSIRESSVPWPNAPASGTTKATCSTATFAACSTACAG